MAYKFCLIAFLDDPEKLERFASSITDTDPFVKKDLVVYIASSYSSEETVCYLDKLNADEGRVLFKYKEYPGKTQEAIYNKVFNLTKAAYVSFTLVSTYYTPGALEDIHATVTELKGTKLFSLVPCSADNSGELVPYTPMLDFFRCTENLYRYIKLSSSPYRLQLFLGAYFIKTAYLKKLRGKSPFLKNNASPDLDKELILTLLADRQQYVCLPNSVVVYTYALEDNFSEYSLSHYKSWYVNSLKDWMIPFAKKHSEERTLPKFLQIALLYLTYTRYYCNYQDRNKFALNDSEISELFRKTGEILSFIENEVILSGIKKLNMPIPKTIKLHFLRQKAAFLGKMLEPCFDSSSVYYMFRGRNDTQEFRLTNISDYKIERTETGIATVSPVFKQSEMIKICDICNEKVFLNIINYSNGVFDIDGWCTLGEILTDNYFKLFAKYENTIIPISRSGAYSRLKVFDKQYSRVYRFHLSFRFEPNAETSKLKFFCEINGKRYTLGIRTAGCFSRLSSELPESYWNFTKDYAAKLSPHYLRFVKVDEKEIEAFEETFSAELQSLADGGDRFAEESLQLRRDYFAKREEYANRRIWITYDKLYKAGDNGEYMFNYISSIDSPIEIYYVINSKSPDYKRLKSRENILIYGSYEHKLLSLFAEAILSTHTTVFKFSGFKKEHAPYLSNIFDPVNIHIQHGLTVQSIAHRQGRLNDNFAAYICTSPIERENLYTPEFDFINKEDVVLTGMARYDGLKNNEQHIILITPTWRKFLANSSHMGNVRKHNAFFKNSDYYRIYNSLINDERLIACAKEYGYRIVFLVHPVASAQASDFDKNDYVEIIPASGKVNYEKMLTEASLMVTDYSGVQFDFAYQRKPIIYYHPKDLPPNYDESEAFKYGRDSFGPIFDEHENLINSLCAYIKSGCRLADVYRERIDKFFAFDDFNNCERVYRCALERTNRKRGCEDHPGESAADSEKE